MSNLKTTIEAAKEKLNVSMTDLSLMIGYSKNYLSEMSRRGCSDSKQAEIILLLERVMAGEKIKTVDELLTQLCEHNDQLQDSVEHYRRSYLDMQKKCSQLTYRLQGYCAYIILSLIIGVVIGWCL